MMRVLCDNCGATYKIPEDKLRKEVNKATCRKCGHRMLIRREPAAEAAASPSPTPSDADERTLVTSAAEVQRTAREHASKSSGGMHIPTGAPSARPAPHPATQPPSQPASGRWAGGNSAQPHSAEWGAPPAAPSVAPPPIVSDGRRARPEPRPQSDGRAVAAHDPAGDLTVALIGGLVAMLGALVLAVNLDGGAAQRFVGLLLALWGSLVAVLVVLTGRRGRKQASVVVSIMLSSFLALVGSTVVAVASGLGSIADGGLAAFDSLSRSTAADQPVVAPPPEVTDESVHATIEKLLAEEAPVTDDGGDAVADADGEDGPAEGHEVADAATGSAPDVDQAAPTAASSQSASVASTPASGADVGSSRSSSSNTSGRTTSGSTSPGSSSSPESSTSASRSSSPSSSTARSSAAASTPEPEPAPEPAQSTPSSPSKGAMDTLPLTVVDTIIRNNKGIKRCFLLEKQRSGTLPSKVNVRFTVLSSGIVSSAAIAGGSYADTELDSCLSSAFYDLQFPAFEGDALKMTYPFVL